MPEVCYGVCASRDNILLGGRGVVYMLDFEGAILRKIQTIYFKDIYSICFSENSQQVICRGSEILHALTLTGDVVYTHNVSGESGLTLDREGNVYYSDETLNEIIRLSSDGNYKLGIPNNDKVKGPSTLAFNKSFSKLFIVSRFESVQIYSCCWSMKMFKKCALPVA